MFYRLKNTKKCTRLPQIRPFNGFFNCNRQINSRFGKKDYTYLLTNNYGKTVYFK